MLFDTHCHLASEELYKNLDYYITNARANDVSNILVMGTNYIDNIESIKISNKYDLYAAVGIYPDYVETEKYENLEKLLNEPRVKAIGECGIDLYWRDDNLNKQKEAFLFQVKLAIKYNLPLSIHSRNSICEVIDILKPYKGKVKGVFHSFTDSYDKALEVIDLGFLIGVGGILTFKKSTDLQEVIKEVPLKHIVLETDAPYLAPVPKRGKVNEPAFIKYTAKFLSELKNRDYLEVVKITTDNARKLFKV